MNTRSRALLLTLLLLALYFVTRAYLPHEVTQPTVPRLHISHTALVTAPPTFTVQLGSTFHLIIESAVSGSIHVHGYEHTVIVDKGVPVTLEFVADRPNVFPIHLHQPLGGSPSNEGISHRHVATLHVLPQ